MNIKCLLGIHNWQFVYNHSMPRGLSTEDALKMLQNGEAYEVYVCTKCGKQSRLHNSRRVILSRNEVETP